jgi:tRNA wybutosine-synthesizing protein 3
MHSFFCVRIEGGMLHIHGNVNDSEESTWVDYIVQSITRISQNEGNATDVITSKYVTLKQLVSSDFFLFCAPGLVWHVSMLHVERVKWYGPHILHLVADVKCAHI